MVKKLKIVGAKKLNVNDEFMTFHAFLKALKKVGANNIDGHTFLVSEFSFLSDADYDYIIGFESFKRDLSILIESLFGIAVEVPHKGVKTNSNIRVDEFYTPSCIELVRSIYESDFSELGYSVEIEDCQCLPDLKKKGISLQDYYASVL